MLSYGASEEAVRAAAGSLLSLVQSRASEEEFRALHHKLRGLTRLLKVAAEPVEGDGDRPPEVEAARKALVDDGLNEMRVANTLRMFGDYFRERAGPEYAALIEDLADLKRS